MAAETISSKRWVIIGLLSVGMIIAYVDRGNLSVALAVPDFIRMFHLSDTDRGTLNSAFFWSYAALQIPAGWVVDRYGVKIPYAFSFLFWCLASAGTALTRSVITINDAACASGRRRSGCGTRELPLDPLQLRREGARARRGPLYDGHEDRPCHRGSARGLVDHGLRLADHVPGSRAGRPHLADPLDAPGQGRQEETGAGRHRQRPGPRRRCRSARSWRAL